MYALLSNIYEDKELKKSFNELTKKVFKFSFEDWDQKGFWTNNFRPYVLVDHGKVISNVSVNYMTFMLDGEEKHYIQLGTVMTDPDYRKQGLGRYIMEQVLNEYQDKVDGIYLFGNDSVLEYYPKFGFKVSTEYEYYKTVDSSNARMIAKKVDMTQKENIDKIIKAYQTRVMIERFSMIKNDGIVGFYATQAMSDCYYYIKEEDAYCVAEREENQLLIHLVIADHAVNLDHIIAAFGDGIEEVVYMFTPQDTTQLSVRIHKEDDATLFYIGEDLEKVTDLKLMFPTTSHT